MLDIHILYVIPFPDLSSVFLFQMDLICKLRLHVFKRYFQLKPFYSFHPSDNGFTRQEVRGNLQQQQTVDRF